MEKLMKRLSVKTIQATGCTHPDLAMGILCNGVYLSAGQMVRYGAGSIFLREREESAAGKPHKGEEDHYVAVHDSKIRK
jgi:hypothetical protein